MAGAPVPELRRLRYFVAVARTRNFTRAAAQLHVAQPALSRQVRLLEEELGVELLRRTTHDVKLTAAGRHLLEEGPALLGAADELWRAARAFGAGVRGRVVVGYGASAGYETVPQLVQGIAKRLPELEVATRLLSLGEIIDGLRGATLDVGVARCPPRSPDLDRRVLRHEPQGVLLRRDDPRATGPGFDLATLGETALLLHPREANPGHYDAVLGLCRARGVDPRIRHRNVTLDLAQTPVAAGEAVAIVGASSRVGSPERLVWLPLAPPATFEVQLLARGAGRSPATDALLAAAAAVADERGWRATAGDAAAD